MDIYWIIPLLVLIAALYASVGHGGASGYLAVMALAGLAPDVMKPTALSLNLLVSLLAMSAFMRAGHFRWRLFWPFALCSVPFAFVGGHFQLPHGVFHLMIAAVLIFSAIRLFINVSEAPHSRRPPLWGIAIAGSLMGLVSGFLGVGGGIFLTPLLLLFGWANPKIAAAVSAPFIFVNSAAGLIGFSASTASLPSLWLVLAPAVLAGGFIGARWGSSLAPPVFLRRSLAAVLMVAVVKLLVV